MNDYLNVVKREVDRFDEKPVLIGHSMGGALVQWYLKKVADDLPATVLIASWTSHSTYADGTLLHLKRDPVGAMLSSMTLSTTPFIRSPEKAASMLISKGSLYSVDELYEKLCDESGIVLMQHNPPFWCPKKSPETPMLWVAAEDDAVISLRGAESSAKFYRADFVSIKNSNHNLMMEHNYKETLNKVEHWLSNTLK